MAERYEGGPSTFHIRVDDGPEQTITTATGIYRDAAAAVPAVLGYYTPVVVEIWCPRLLPDYGPYLYRVRDDEYGGIVAEHVVRIGYEQSQRSTEG